MSTPPLTSPTSQHKPIDPAVARARRQHEPASPSTETSSSEDAIVTPEHSPSARAESSASTSSPVAPKVAVPGGSGSASSGVDPAASWWFDGRSAQHEDWFIDLHGNKTDHLPDVRTYLIAMGSTKDIPGSHVMTQEERDQWRLEYGKKRLLKAWRQGEGYFLSPDAPNRDYGSAQALQTEGMPGWGTPWYADLRATLETAMDERAKVTAYGDKGYRYDPFPGWDRNVDDWSIIYYGPRRASQTPLVKTNLRCPLPWLECTIPRPSDVSQWEKFIRKLYHVEVHPAAEALNTCTPCTAYESDEHRWVTLKWAGFVTPESMSRFDE